MDCRDKFLKFKMGNQDCSRIIVLDREQAERESPHILEQHAIAFDRSPELRYLYDFVWFLVQPRCFTRT